ncbi:MAG: carboxypeptidase regulatory-like domain-containing protein, partial [Chryseobacterium sp.]
MQKILSFFLTLCCVFIFAQKSVSGRITDAQSAAVAGASVTVENPENSVIIAYAISDSKGNYKLTFNSTLDKVRVRVKAFNQKTQSREVSNADQTLNFSLTSDVTEIQEVTLKTKLITKRGDTITYDLKSFESKSDRTLADVLNKVPGMEVAADGSVQYQGKPLAKFYVEGKDLMEGGYGAL